MAFVFVAPRPSQVESQQLSLAHPTVVGFELEDLDAAC